MFVLTNASAASGEIDVTRTGGQYIIAIAQPYTGVGQIVPSPLTQNMVNANPAILPSGVTSFDVTIPGSMGVAGLGWLFGTANGLAFPSFRSQFIGSAQAVVLTDQTYPTIGPQVISFAWSSTSGTPTYTRIAVLLVPRLIPQPPVGSGDEDAPDNLSDPDDRLWADADEW
jgi:hypothetical protein